MNNIYNKFYKIIKSKCSYKNILFLLTFIAYQITDIIIKYKIDINSYIPTVFSLLYLFIFIIIYKI